ncbi:DUF86 domain-containing protein [Candidatus Binatia bacterium]|nr:DUF86 domain-containing protein [Candidatus Binatia bacterium]
MRPDRLLLEDMIEALDEVLSCTPATRGEFDADKFRQSHILRHIQILGETAWRLFATIKDQHPEIPWSQMAGMRHALVHDYFEVDWDEVYDTARRDVPSVKPRIEAILASLPPESEDQG